jgi:hypothetical protein
MFQSKLVMGQSTWLLKKNKNKNKNKKKQNKGAPMK